MLFPVFLSFPAIKQHWYNVIYTKSTQKAVPFGSQHPGMAENEKCATLMRRRGYLRSAGSSLGMVWRHYIHKRCEFDARNTQIYAGLGLPGRNYCVAPNEGVGIDWEGQNNECEMDIHYIQHVWCSQIKVWVTLAVQVPKTSMGGGGHAVSTHSLDPGHQMALEKYNLYQIHSKSSPTQQQAPISD